MGGKSANKNFSDYFEIPILKAYKKPLTRLVEEGTYISSHKGELLNSKNEWHQAVGKDNYESDPRRSRCLATRRSRR